MKSKRQAEATRVEAGPFGSLLASRPPRNRPGAVAATLASLVWHAGLLGGLVHATRAIASEAGQEEEVYAVTEMAPPPLPPPPAPASEPSAPAVDVPFGHQVLAVPEFVPPEIAPPDLTQRFDPRDFQGIGREGGRGGGIPSGGPTAGDGTISPDEAPKFMLMEVMPRILNAEDVVRALERSYPGLLRDAGIGGDVTVWFYIDARGRVLKRQIDRTSGYDALDAVALKVADVMRFAPAENRGVPVPVWVSLPIRFRTR